ncbi:MAG: hypothetical protein ACRDT2_14270 [Natronosporangium sp.]
MIGTFGTFRGGVHIGPGAPRPRPTRHRLALVLHPDRPGFVSLPAAATDAAGNAVQQTVLRAYGFS